MGHGERVVTGSFLGKAEFTFQAKKKNHALVYLFLLKTFLLQMGLRGSFVRCTVEIGAGREVLPRGNASSSHGPSRVEFVCCL